MPRVDPTSLTLQAHAQLGLRCCRKCGAPEGMRVVRIWAQPTLWSLDTDLHLEHPDVYRWPSKVIIEKDSDGICRWCSQPRGASSDLSRVQARLAREAARGQE